jgi:drug/metabolite transporter (DMT)-like permease
MNTDVRPTWNPERGTRNPVPSSRPVPAAAAGWLVGLSLAGALVGWGWAWVGIRAAVRHYEPGTMALGRHLIAALALLPFWLARGARLPTPLEWPRVVAMGLLGFTVYNLLINAGGRSIPAGTSSFIAASIPVMLTVGGRIFFGERLRPAGWIGVAVALAGVAVIAFGSGGGLRFSRGALLVLAGAVCTAAGGLVSKELLARHAPLEIATWSMWIGTLGLLPAGWGLPEAVRTAPWPATANMIALGLVSGALCQTMWTFAISRMPISRAANWRFLIPAVSVVLGWLILGELPAPAAFAGGIVTLCGVVIVDRFGRATARPPAAVPDGSG